MGSHDIPTQPEGRPRFWYRDNFFLTNDKSFLDPDAFNKSLDDLWWSNPLPPNLLNKVLSNCLTLGIYRVPQTAEDMRVNGIARQGPRPKMVGFARVVTDYVTIGYLTDVFVLDEFRGCGLGSWLMRALKELISGWPQLRGLLLMCHDQDAARLYSRELGALPFDEGPSAGMAVLEVPGPAEKPTPGH